MQPTPIYTEASVRPVHALRYDWTGWLREKRPFPELTRSVVEQLSPLWRDDGMALESANVQGDRVQCLFVAAPALSPVACARRAKGRLQQALRQAGVRVSFSRRVSLRTLGVNTSQTVAGYIGGQASRSDYADPRFKQFLREQTIVDPSVQLAEPARGAHGRYWYNLHLVLVVQDRDYPVTRRENFGRLRDGCQRIATKKGYGIAALSIMPDHIHAALKGATGQSPLDIGLAFLNNLAWLMGYNRVWSEEFYVGTFSEYRVGAVLRG